MELTIRWQESLFDHLSALPTFGVLPGRPCRPLYDANDLFDIASGLSTLADGTGSLCVRVSDGEADEHGSVSLWVVCLFYFLDAS